MFSEASHQILPPSERGGVRFWRIFIINYIPFYNRFNAEKNAYRAKNKVIVDDLLSGNVGSRHVWNVRNDTYT